MTLHNLPEGLALGVAFGAAAASLAGAVVGFVLMMVDVAWVSRDPRPEQKPLRCSGAGRGRGRNNGGAPTPGRPRRKDNPAPGNHRKAQGCGKGESLADTVEVRGFSFLWERFRQRGWPNPLRLPWPEPAPASALVAALEIDPEQVEAVFVNGVVRRPDAVIHPGDRVALLPPGTPGPYRVLLGIWSGGTSRGEPREGAKPEGHCGN